MSIRGRNAIRALKTVLATGVACMSLVAGASSSWAAAPVSEEVAITSSVAVANGNIMLRNDMNNKCLQAATPNGSQASMWDCRGTKNFYWYWDGMQIRNAQSGKCLEILSLNNSNGAQAGVWDCWGGANQKWYWDGMQLRNLMNNKCLEILSFHNENGSLSGMWDCWGGANQRWK